MEVSDSFCLPVAEASQVGDARRRAGHFAAGRGLDEAATARLALVVTELAGNLVKHPGQGGEMVIRGLQRGAAAGVEVLAMDRGSGMADVAEALRDGYSTTGTAGTGLGAVSRNADLFQIHSAPGTGTAILAQVWTAPPGPSPSGLEVGAVAVMKPGQSISGDAWTAEEAPGRLLLVVVDGLGHGSEAAEASREAVRVAREHADQAPLEILDRMHGALRGTRGAAGAVAEIDRRRGSVRFAGVGNIAGSVLAGEVSRSVVSMNGIVGHETRRLQDFSYPWEPGSILVLHSDGIGTRWDLSRYAGLAARHPSLIAGVLFRDFTRGTDDATVAVAR